MERLSAEQVGSSADCLRPNTGGEVKNMNSHRLKGTGNFNYSFSCYFYLFHIQFGEAQEGGSKLPTAPLLGSYLGQPTLLVYAAPSCAYLRHLFVVTDCIEVGRVDCFLSCDKNCRDK